MTTNDSSELFLSPDQQDLLMAALNSNKAARQHRKNTQSPEEKSISQSQNYTPGGLSDFSGHMPGSGRLDYSDESPYLDFDLDGEVDDTFNFGQPGQMIGDLPSEDGDGDSLEDHLHDKRKSIGDRDDDDDEGGGKRREGDDKQAKKPGRKPLTSEPTSVSTIRFVDFLTV